MRGRPASSETFTSGAFLRPSTNTLNRLSEAADTLVAELALADEAAVAKAGAGSLGERVVAAETPDAVLRIITESDAYSRIKARMGRDGDKGDFRPERAAYGYADPVFDDAYGTRVASRALVCIAADVWFDPYATGLFDATQQSLADLRVEIRSATSLIWNWGTFDHQALARALSAARLHPNGEEWMPFEPFTILLERLLMLHRDDDPSWCRVVGERLSSFAVERLWHVRPGRTAVRHLSTPALTLIRDEFGLDLGVDVPASSTEALIAAAAPWCRDVFFGRRSPTEAVAFLTKLAAGLGSLEGQSDDA